MQQIRKIIILFLILSILGSCNLIDPQKSSTTLGTTTLPVSSTSNTMPNESTTKPTPTTTTQTTTTTTTTTTSSVIENDPPIDEDPYANISEEKFYANYTPATSYWDAYYRTQHYFMSGSIEDQDQEPTVAENQPMENGLYIRNTSALYSEDGNTYYVIDAEGNIVNKIFKGAAYVTLEEVAAYIMAFGDVPANYSSNKKTKPSDSPWGKYLRVNNTKFTGDTSRYPYEPELPDISGCGGDLTYYEIDIGTTGTDCDPSYTATIYNNGTKITRGAARIVYTRFDKNGNNIIDIDEKYVFYTYNHYNDFQEYLNYEGGWGEMFGNITGGGTISSKYDYNPTPYVAVVRKNLYTGAREGATLEYIEVAFVCFDKKYFWNSTYCA